MIRNSRKKILDMRMIRKNRNLYKKYLMKQVLKKCKYMSFKQMKLKKKEKMKMQNSKNSLVMQTKKLPKLKKESSHQ